MTILGLPGLWLAILALASVFIALLHRRWGWLGFALGAASLIGVALAAGAYQAAGLPPITTPPKLNWLCLATPIPVSLAGALTILALAGASLKLPKAELQFHIVLNISVSTVAFVVCGFLTTFVYVVGYLGCDTV